MTLLKRILFFLYQNKRITAFGAVFYSIGIILLHDTFVNVSVAIMNRLTLPVYNLVVASIILTVFTVLMIFLLPKLIQSYKKLQIFIVFVTFLLAIHVLTMFEMNIEIIHVAEYALLTILLYTIVPRLSFAIIFALPVMFVDEFIQYKILYPSYVTYFELNDILLDMLGSAWVILGLKTLKLIPEEESIPLNKQPEWAVLALIYMFILLSWLNGKFEFYESNSTDRTIFAFSTLSENSPFWQKHPFTKATYHILTPIQGISAILLLALAFGVYGIFPDKRT